MQLTPLNLVCIVLFFLIILLICQHVHSTLSHYIYAVFTDRVTLGGGITLR